MTIYDAIERIAIFEKASPKMKSKIISYAILKKYSEQQILFREREQVKSIYLLVSGNVILYRYNHQGNRKVVFVCGKGEILNEVILEQEIASISCQTLVESIVLVIQRNHFLELLEDDTLARAIICSALYLQSATLISGVAAAIFINPSFILNQAFYLNLSLLYSF